MLWSVLEVPCAAEKNPCQSDGISYRYLSIQLVCDILALKSRYWIWKIVSISVPVARIKYQGNSNSGKISFILVHSSGVLSIMAGNSWQQGPEAAGPIASLLRKQRHEFGLPTFSFLCSSGPKPREWCHPVWGWTFVPQLTQIIPHRHAMRRVS